MSKEIVISEDKASEFCDEYCKFPLTTRTQFELDEVCRDCPLDIKDDELLTRAKQKAVDLIHNVDIGSGIHVVTTDCDDCRARIRAEVIDEFVAEVKNYNWIIGTNQNFRIYECIDKIAEDLKERNNG